MKKILLSLLAQSQGWNWIFEEPPSSRQVKGCQDNEVLIACPTGDVVSVKKAFYGRKDLNICAAHPSEIKNKNCESNPLEEVQSRCNNRETCRLPVDMSVFEDPCPETSKYLQVDFECVKHLFEVPKKYFLPSRSVEFSVPAPGTWSEDPISSSIYFLKFDTSRTTELYEFSSFNEFREANFKSLRPSFSLTVPALDAKFATWDRNIYYLTSSKMIKYSTSQLSQVDTIDLSEEISSSSDLFNPSLDLMTSETGLFGVIRLGRSESRFRILQFSTEGKLRISDRWEVNLNSSRKRKTEDQPTTLIIGDVLYVLRNGKLTGAVNFKTTELLDFDESAVFDISGLVSYNPSGSLSISDDQMIRKIELEFSDSLTTTTTTTTTTSTTSKSTKTATEKMTTEEVITSDDPRSSYSSTSSFCPATVISSYSFPETEQLTLASVPCPNGSGSATYWCDRGTWSLDGPDFSECSEIQKEIQKTYPWSDEIESLWRGNNHSLVLQRVQAEIPSLQKAAATKLVKEVAQVMNSSKQDISDSALNLFEELHCRSLLNSEQFLYLAFSSSSLLEISPQRCGEQIYRQFDSTDRGNLSAGAKCEVLIQEEWTACVFCDLCPQAMFIRIEEQSQSPLFSAFYIATLFSTIIVSVLLFIIAISRVENLLYPGILRLLTVLSVLFCDLSLILTPDYGMVSINTTIFRDTAFSFFVILEFMFLLGISHSLRQRTKPVSSPNFHVERYLCLAAVTSLILVVGTYAAFIIFGPQNTSGWLHLGWTWTISLILPVLVSSLISMSWFLQSLCVDSPVRVVAAKMLPFLVMTLMSTVVVVVSFGQPSSKTVEWTACFIFMTKTVMLVIAFIPSAEDVSNPFLWWSRRFGPRNRKEGGTIESCKTGHMGATPEQSWLIADNRASLAEFRYIPVVHNLTNPNYAKPRAYLSSERIYSEIGPPENHPIDHYRPATIQHFRQDSCQTWSEELSNNSNNSQRERERKREDSGVHTAQNSSDSERNSPVRNLEKIHHHKSESILHPSEPVNI